MKLFTVILAFATGCLVLIASSAVERHRLHSFSFQEGKPRIGFSWDREAYSPGERLEVFYTTSLTSSWKLVHTEVVREGVPSVEYVFKDIRPDADGGFFTVRRFVDSDGDGTSDAREELEFHSNPFSLDSDLDTILDEEEIARGMNPADPDSDHDGVSDEFESRFGTNPLSADTDGDGIGDSDEMYVYMTNPISPDSDGDGLSDAEEIEIGQDPVNDYSVDPRFPDRIMKYFEGWDPFSYPEGSTNMCWVHLFYSGSPDGEIKIPESSDDKAVLKIKVSGTGVGLISGVGGRPHVVFGDEPKDSPQWLSVRPPESCELKVGVERGLYQEIVIDAPPSLSLSFSSDDFMIGEHPTYVPGYNLYSGWYEFPNTVVKGPCFHYLGDQTVRLGLDVGWGMEKMTCTWHAEDSGLSVENLGDRAARISGSIDIGTLEKVKYTLWHPYYLDGQREYNQRANYCLPEEEDDPDDDDDDDSGEGSHPTGDYDYDYDYDEDDHERTGGDDDDDDDDDPDPPDDDEDVEALLKLSRHTDVLILREPYGMAEIDLKVPPQPERCCDCPEHQVKSVTAKIPHGGIRVTDEAGVSFRETSVDQKLRVIGVSPSSEIGGGQLSFVYGKKEFERHNYTVLGLTIDSRQFDLKMLNTWSPEMGLPVSVGDYVHQGYMSYGDLKQGIDVSLICDVGLPRGKIKLEFVNPTGRFQLWVYRDVGMGWELLLDSEEKPELEMTIGEWRAFFGLNQTGESRVRILASSAGQTSLKWTYACRSGDGVICDEIWQRLSAVAPRLIFDYDRNGQIDSFDWGDMSVGRTFRFWVNDDGDSREVEEGLVDLSGEDGNCADASVNGKRDFVDFTPVCVDLSEAFPEICSSKVRDAVVWRIASDCVNIVQTALPQDKAGVFQTQDMGPVFGRKLDRELKSANVEKTDEGCVLDPRLTRAALQGEYGIVLMEGCAPGKSLRLEGWLEGEDVSVKLMECQAKISVSEVDQMYRWIDIRQAEDLSVPIRDSGVPSNWSPPDYSGADERSFVFVHGFNVNVQEARAWAAEMYKRLWQAGFDGQFVAVDWTGDSSQFHLWLKDDNYAPDYYVNVRNAFNAAKVLPQALKNLGGQKTLLAHSLGNMLVSSSAVDHHLEYERYYMLNAAVPMEAYDATAYAGAMVDTEWKRVPQQYWASYWGQLFGEDDFRRSLNWRGRFAGLRNVVNVYSSTEDVLGNPKEGQLTFIGGAWKIQELSKGTTTWYDINSLPIKDLDVVCEGGWGINSEYAYNPHWYVYQYGYTEYAGTTITREQAIAEPLFTPFRACREQMRSSSVFGAWQIADPEALRARFLGDAIPATSFAQGANAASPRLNWANVSLTELADHLDSWPRGTPKNGVCEWRHSDLKNLPYFNVHKVFEKIVKGE